MRISDWSSDVCSSDLSHMWLVSEQYFCTSNSLAVWMMASGFSCASTTLVCRAEYTSLKLMLVGADCSALNMDVHSGLTGTRIFRSWKSSGPLMGLVLVVISRKPRSEEHTSELQSLMRISYAVFCLK